VATGPTGCSFFFSLRQRPGGTQPHLEGSSTPFNRGTNTCPSPCQSLTLSHHRESAPVEAYRLMDVGVGHLRDRPGGQAARGVERVLLRVGPTPGRRTGETGSSWIRPPKRPSRWRARSTICTRWATGASTTGGTRCGPRLVANSETTSAVSSHWARRPGQPGDHSHRWSALVSPGAGTGVHDRPPVSVPVEGGDESGWSRGTTTFWRPLRPHPG
jgi:hypothetical protein